MWSGIEGVYVPAFFDPEWDEHGFQTLVPRFSDYTKIKRTILSDLDNAPFPDAPIIPYGKPVHDRLRLEISRGCTRGCRFCQAGMIYRPVRERSPERLLSLSDTALGTTGYEDISLLSLSTGDYRCIAPLMEALMKRCESEHVAVSFPSLRAGTLTPELMELIKKVRKTGFTIAPEAGTQRLRDVINKNISKDDIFDTVNDAFRLGWQVIKLYFMIGLPTETDSDLEGIVDLVKELRKIKGPKGKARKGSHLNVSVTTFIPKPHTPFQWVSQLPLARSKEKIYGLQDQLKMPGIRFKWQNPEVSLLEGLWARGDRRLSSLLVTAYKKGCKFDGWSDKFRYDLWKEAISEEGIDIGFYTTRKRDMAEPLPWDHIDIGVTKDFLKKEWEKALEGKCTPDCRDGDCNTCGVCDFKRTEPKVFGKLNPEPGNRNPKPGTRNPEPGTRNPGSQPIFFKKFKVSYSKQGQAKYFGHLELVNIFLRAIRRAGIPLKYSEGFHPMPKISFEDPLPIGMESLNESFYLFVPDTVKPQAITDLNNYLPEGLVVRDCQLAIGKSLSKTFDPFVYLIRLKHGVFDEDKLKSFTELPELILTRMTRKGKLKKRDLKDIVLKIDLPDPQQLKMTVKSEPGKTARPSEIMKAVFELPEETIKQASVLKINN